MSTIISSEEGLTMTQINREKLPYYQGLDQAQVESILETIGLKSVSDVFGHINEKLDTLDLPKGLQSDELRSAMKKLASQNRGVTHFLGRSLWDMKRPKVLEKILGLRGLTTAYTPYQPERSQGTLQTLWIFQTLFKELTGFEAINASLYDRSTATYEALKVATRIKKKNQIYVASSLHPNDKEVLETHVANTSIELHYLDYDKESGQLILPKEVNPQVAGIIFSHINSFGVIEDVDQITRFCHEHQLLAIAQVEPLLYTNLKSPIEWGGKDLGAHIIVGEMQNLCLGPNFGGPGLGLFGIRYHEGDKLSIRQAPGRFVGKALDEFGNECKAIILSTREQHIRRDKATSNICSNQSFVATLAGASLLCIGSEGLKKHFETLQKNAERLARDLTCFESLSLKFPDNPVTHKLVFEFNHPKITLKELFDLMLEKNIALGERLEDLSENTFMLTVTNVNGEKEFTGLVLALKQILNDHSSIGEKIKSLKPSQLTQRSFKLPRYEEEEVYAYYKLLSDQNMSPDNALYPLGSCTMKYNPLINDEMASLEEFSQSHPDLDPSCVQGNLRVLLEIQNWFEKITGLKAVTTMPVAGAQGELVGLKLFQAYHQDRGDHQRTKIIIPKSAHGTNPATAVVAGFEGVGANKSILDLKASSNGEMDIDHLKELIQAHGPHIAGIMVTNPNTCGLFERNFKLMADMIHEVGGLVYMDGANMNAIAGIVDLSKLGVDAVHNNLHKTWSIPHGGGGPGDAIVAVSDKLVDFLPGLQFQENDQGLVEGIRPKKSIGRFHRHHGNFAHKVRALTYLYALGAQGIEQMSTKACLSAKYLFHHLKENFPTLPRNTEDNPRMHEFIITLKDEHFKNFEKLGLRPHEVIARVGKLFLDFGYHAPTVSFPEPLGLMIEPTESFTLSELDKFIDDLKALGHIISDYPEVLLTTPHFTPIGRIDELSANKAPLLYEQDTSTLLTPPLIDQVPPEELRNLDHKTLLEKILEAHHTKKAKLKMN